MFCLKYRKYVDHIMVCNILLNYIILFFYCSNLIFTMKIEILNYSIEQ